MLKTLLKTFWTRPAPPAGASPKPNAPAARRSAVPVPVPAPASVPEIFAVLEPSNAGAYPPPTPRIYAIAPDVLIAAQNALVLDLRETLQLYPEQFDSLVRPALLRFAEWAHLLPASESHHHSTPGGLLHHSIEVAVFATKLFKGTRPILSDDSPSLQRRREQRMMLAACFAGLLHDIGKPLVDISVTNPDGTEWSPHVCSLWKHLQSTGADSYTIGWRPGPRHGRHETYGVAVARDILGDALMAWMSEEASHETVRQLINAISGTPAPNNPLAEIMSRADQNSVKKDRRRERDRILAAGRGGILGLPQRIVSLIAEKVEDGTLPINANGGMLFAVNGELWGAYPRLLTEIAGELKKQGVEYVPFDGAELLKTLRDTGIADLTNKLVFDAQGGSELSLTVFRFARPDLIAPPEMIPKGSLGTLRDKSGEGAKDSEPDAPAPAGVPVATAPPAAAPAAPAPAPAPAAAVQQPPVAQGEKATPPPQPAPAIEIQDRRNRGDIARENSVEAASRDAGKSLPDMLEMLSGFGLEGFAMKYVFDRITSRAMPWGVDVADAGGRLALRLPKGLEGCGVAPLDLLRQLSARGWTVPNSRNAGAAHEVAFADGPANALLLNGLPASIYQAMRAAHPDLFRPGAAQAAPASEQAPEPASEPEPPVAQASSDSEAAAAVAAVAARKDNAGDENQAPEPEPESGREVQRVEHPIAFMRLPMKSLAITSMIDAKTDICEAIKGELFLQMLNSAAVARRKDPGYMTTEEIRQEVIAFAGRIGTHIPVVSAIALSTSENPLLLRVGPKARGSMTAQDVRKIPQLTINPDYTPPAWAMKSALER